MTVTAASFRDDFPEFVSVSDARINRFLAVALNTLNESYWGVHYDEGTNYFVAHKLALALKSEAAGGSGSGAGGPISSRGVDGASVSYAVRTSDNSKEAYYAQTSYGLEYWASMKSLPVAAASI